VTRVIRLCLLRMVALKTTPLDAGRCYLYPWAGDSRRCRVTPQPQRGRLEHSWRCPSKCPSEDPKRPWTRPSDDRRNPLNYLGILPIACRVKVLVPFSHSMSHWFDPSGAHHVTPL